MNRPSLLQQEFSSLLEGETYPLTAFANAAALLFDRLEQVNWAGFYFVRGDVLQLGPFQGKPACTRIGRGKGVCGAAWQTGRTVRVEDVHAFAGHIACDSASRSELVIPLHRGRTVYGVLDLDSPVLSRFTAADQAELEACAAALDRWAETWGIPEGWEE